MYKISIVLSMLCVPLVSFGMDSGFYFSHVDALSDLDKIENNHTAPYFNHVGFLEPQIEAQSLSAAVQEESSSQESEPAQNASMPLPYFFVDSGLLGEASSQQETQSIPYNAALQPAQEFDIAFYESGAQEMDSALDDQVMQEAAQSSSLSSALLLGVALQQSYPEARDEILDGQANNEDMEPSALYSESALKSIQARFAKNKKKCPFKNCSKSSILSTHTVDHVAARHHICLLCNPLYCANRAGIEEHFTQKHPGQSFVNKVKKEACKKCGAVMSLSSLKKHAERCKGIKNIRYYTLSELDEYAENRKQCPIKTCQKSLSVNSDITHHVASMHRICLLCNPLLPYRDTKSIQEHFRQQHTLSKYAIDNRKIACEQCGKEMLEKTMKRHLREACKGMGSDAAAVMSDKN